MTDKIDPPAAAPASPTVRITLHRPIPREGGDVTELTLREPDSGELRGLKVGDLFNGDTGSVITLLPRITTPYITVQEAEKLSLADIGEIAGTVTGFFMTPAQKALVAKMQGASG